MGSITIHSPGLMTSIQDCGRFGYQRFGMPISGAMDIFSLQIANLLTGNNVNAACLEATLSGPEIIFNSSCTIAITGADMRPKLNGKPIQCWETTVANQNDRLSFEGLKTGCRTYIAFSGGIDVPVVMKSRSTYLRAKIGGFEGRALQKGDMLQLGVNCSPIIRQLPAHLIPEYSANQTIRVIPGPEVNRFGFDSIRDFLVSEFTISPNSDRMGYRLDGPPICVESGSADIISAGISSGTIQVTGNGQLIILMSDRQTTGGYSRIANVATVDLPLVAQMKPGDTLRFREITVEEAQKLIAERWESVFLKINPEYFNLYS